MDDLETRKTRMEDLLARINAIEQRGIPVEFTLELDTEEPIELYINADTEDSWIQVYDGEGDIYLVYAKGMWCRKCNVEQVLEVVRHWLKYGDFPETKEQQGDAS